MQRILLLLAALTLAACGAGDAGGNAQAKRKCEDLKGSSRIMAMNCE